MSRKLLGVVIPLTATVLVLAVVWLISETPAIRNGITAGMTIAFLQSVLSTAALDWAWEKKYVYWVWGGGMLCRMIIFAATAFVVFRYTNLGFVSTMVSMVTATTAFLVVESYLFFGKR